MFGPHSHTISLHDLILEDKPHQSWPVSAGWCNPQFHFIRDVDFDPFDESISIMEGRQVPETPGTLGAAIVLACLFIVDRV